MTDFSGKKRFLTAIIKFQVNLRSSQFYRSWNKKRAKGQCAGGQCAGGLVRLAKITGNIINCVNATQKTSDKMLIYKQ